MNHDAVDYFRVDFTPDESIVGGKYYPLGTFAAEALECGLNVSEEIHRSLKRFQEEFQVFPGGQRSVQRGHGAPCHAAVVEGTGGAAAIQQASGR